MVRGLIALVVFGISTGTLPAANVNWLDNFEAAVSKAAELKKPLLIHFYADWCIPCKRLDRVVFGDRQLAESIDKDYVPLKVNLELHPRLAERFGITSIPADVILTPTGEVIANQLSPSNVEQYSKNLAKMNAQERDEAPVPLPAVAAASKDGLAVAGAVPADTPSSSSFFGDAMGEGVAGSQSPRRRQATSRPPLTIDDHGGCHICGVGR